MSDASDSYIYEWLSEQERIKLHGTEFIRADVVRQQHRDLIVQNRMLESELREYSRAIQSLDQKIISTQNVVYSLVEDRGEPVDPDPTPDEIVEGWIAELEGNRAGGDDVLLHDIAVYLANRYWSPVDARTCIAYICATARQILANNSVGANRDKHWWILNGKNTCERIIALSLSCANTGSGGFVERIQGIENAAFQWLLLDLKERGE